MVRGEWGSLGSRRMGLAWFAANGARLVSPAEGPTRPGVWWCVVGGLRSGLGFGSFAARMGPVAVLGLAANYAMLRLAYPDLQVP